MLSDRPLNVRLRKEAEQQRREAERPSIRREIMYLHAAKIQEEAASALDAKDATIARLTQERDEARLDKVILHQMCAEKLADIDRLATFANNYKTRAEAAEARIAKLEGALRGAYEYADEVAKAELRKDEQLTACSPMTADRSETLRGHRVGRDIADVIGMIVDAAIATDQPHEPCDLCGGTGTKTVQWRDENADGHASAMPCPACQPQGEKP